MMMMMIYIELEPLLYDTIIYYDARSTKHRISSSSSQIITIATAGFKRNTLHNKAARNHCNAVRRSSHQRVELTSSFYRGLQSLYFLLINSSKQYQS
jgi:hypothetical protein